MDIRYRHRLLKTMGVDYWLSRSESILHSQQPIFSAVCLVVLSENPSLLNEEQRKTLTGMLKVLMLTEEELCLAWINPVSLDQAVLQRDLMKWAPYSVLMMGTTLSGLLLTPENPLMFAGILESTYDPIELQKEPKQKRKAYEDLLRLKEKIATLQAA